MEIIIDECIAKSTRLILKEAGFKIINLSLSENISELIDLLRRMENFLIVVD